MKKISIVMPAYNEEKRIGPTLDAYTKFFDEKHPEYEILIITNNCTDNTVGLIEEYMKKYPKIRHKNYDELGDGGNTKGLAVVKGFENALGDLVGFVDADNSTDPENFYSLIDNFKGHGVIASRYLPESDVPMKQSFFRRLLSRGFNKLVTSLFFMKYKDTQCGAKVFDKNAIDKVIPKLQVPGWAFDIEILYWMKKYGFKVKEHPIRWVDAEGSQLNTKKVVPKMLKSVLELRFKTLFFII